MRTYNKFSKKLLPYICLLLAAAWSGCGKESPPIPESVKNQGGNGTDPVAAYTHIFKRGDDGYNCYRIPAIIKTKAGTLLAFAEGRKNNCDDEGDIDLVVKRSSDNGKTWGALKVIWSDGENTCGNPAPVIDETTGKIHLLMTWNLGTDDIGKINAGTSTDTRRVFKTSSTDDGQTWEAVTEITATTKMPGWGWYATGPCHGIQIAKGTYAGRLVIPCDYIEVGNGRKGYSHVIYSDDNGANWKLGGVTPSISLNPNESTVTELADGKLLLNMRVSGNNNVRLQSTSSDGGITWTTPVSAPSLVDPVCQGSLTSGLIGGQHTVFFSNPSSINRENMTIKASTDNGASWPKQYTVFAGQSGYSDLVLINQTQIGILYEAGTTRYFDGIAYKNVNISDIK
jgi:sialidase-1